MPYFDFGSTKIYFTDSGITAVATTPTIVFIHGLTSSSKIYARQISYFSQTHRVIAFDLLGHGYSYRPSPAAVDHSVSGQTAVLEALFHNLQIPHAILVAWSVGGFIAVEFTHRHPDKVDGLVMIGTSARFVTMDESDISFPSNSVSIFKKWVDEWTASPRDEGAAFVFLQYPESSTDNYPEYVAEALQDTFSVSTEAMASTLAFEDQRAYYPEIKKRVLLVHGAKDGAVTVDTSKWAYNELGGEKKLVIYENVGHVPHVSNSETFNQDMAAFLNEVR